MGTQFRIIDIHSHILPKVDDGSETMEMSVEMARMAGQSGIYIMVATPHNNLPGLCQDTRVLMQCFTDLRQRLREERIGVVLAAGMELFATWDLPDLLVQKKVWTLNNTHYFLVEFDFEEEPQFCSRVLERCKEKGFIPIIAHPERYQFVQNYPEIVYDWIKKGYGIQVNKGSILGKFGANIKHTAEKLLSCGLVSCVASDAHSSWMRTPHMEEIVNVLIEDYGEAYARLVLEENPRRILRGEKLAGYKPIFPE